METGSIREGTQRRQWLAALACGFALSLPALGEEPGDSRMQELLQPFLAQYCVECHKRGEDSGQPDLSPLASGASLLSHRKLWKSVARQLARGEMPPAEEPQPAPELLAQVRAFLDEQLALPVAEARLDPGHVTLRRLNRFEYRNTVRDLLGVDYAGVDDFPSDDVGYGFDNIGDVLTMSPLLFERYLQAAEAVAAAALTTEDREHPAARHFEAEDLPSTASGGTHRGMRGLSTAGEVKAEVRLPRAGRYRIRVRASGQQAGPEPARMEVSLNARRLKRFNVKAPRDEPEIYEIEADAESGARAVTAAFVNDYYKPDDPDPAQRDRNLFIDWIEVVGPIDIPAELPEPHRRIMIASPPRPAAGQPWSAVAWQPAARQILERLAARAFRRPVSHAEVQRLLQLVETELNDETPVEGEPFVCAIQTALLAILVSPDFLFRVERHPAPEDAARIVEISEYELASRLSYFVWASMPDAALFARAESGELRAHLDEAIARMLRDPRASALVDGFAEQWLELRLLDQATPDPVLFPDFDAELRAAMRQETEMLFESILWEDASILDLLTADYTYLNERLAHHYGIAGVSGARFRRVSLAGGQRAGAQRAGLLTQASILTLTSYPTRTSPTKRGKWVLDEILGAPTPPPPPGVPDLAEATAVDHGATMRERMELHRTSPDCASCHARMDPLGFALENFDAIGRWRERDRGAAIDSLGTLPDGSTFSGADGLRALLAGDDRFARTFAARLLTYALGRGLEDQDEPALDEIVRKAAVSGYRLSGFVRAIARSYPFQHQRGQEDHE